MTDDTDFEFELTAPPSPPPDDRREDDWDALFAALDRLGLAGTEAWAELLVRRAGEGGRVTVLRPDGYRDWV